MPTPAAHINTNRANQEVVWCYDRNIAKTGATGSLVFAFCDDESPYINITQLNQSNPYGSTGSNLLISNSNRQFINFKNLFKAQFEAMAEYFDDISFDTANERFSASLNGLLELNPDVISMEVTHEQSIFYTFKKKEYTFFLQHFLNEIDIDEDEAILTVFQGNEKQPSYAGSLSQTISELSSVLTPVNPLKYELELHELSI